MLPNISADVIEKQKTLQPGTCVGFGGGFKIPMIIKLEMPNPTPYSSNADISKCWALKTANTIPQPINTTQGGSFNPTSNVNSNTTPPKLSIAEQLKDIDTLTTEI